jgi:hypothetical protein
MLKIIAYFTMLVDHIGQVYFPDNIIFSIFGRLAFPLFAWGIAKGLKRTSNFKLYALRLMLLAVISQLPYYFLFHNYYLNVCFTLLDGLLILKLSELKISIWLKLPIISALFILSDAMSLEYGMYGITTIILFYFFGTKYYLISLQVIVTIVGISIYNFNPIQLYALLATFFIIFFERYDFKINRAFQYSFYPAHLTLLLLLTYFLPKI